jgi:peptidoglycan/LPS O-acetylase OafA/YrhL
MANKEIRSLTGIRGIAALYVVLFHAFNTIPRNVMPANILHYFLMRGYLSVDLFFILSGFLLALVSRKNFDSGSMSGKKYLDFVRKRFARVYPLYIVLNVLAFAYKKQKNILDFILSIFFLNTLLGRELVLLGPAWSLDVEWIIYLLFPVALCGILILRPRFSEILLVMIAAGLIGLMYYKLGHNNYKVWDITSGKYTFVRGIIDYDLGILFYLLTNRYQSPAPIVQYGSVIVTIAIIALLFIPYSDGLIVVLFGLLVYFLYYQSGPVNQLCAWQPIYYLGLISYSLYLVHPILLFLIYRHNTIPVVFAKIGACLVISHFTYKYVEVKGMDLINGKLKFRRPVAQEIPETAILSKQDTHSNISGSIHIKI